MGSQMVMFGGQSLEDNADLNDLFFLTKVGAPACSQHCVKVLKHCCFFEATICSMIQMSACCHYKSALSCIQLHANAQHDTQQSDLPSVSWNKGLIVILTEVPVSCRLLMGTPGLAQRV